MTIENWESFEGGLMNTSIIPMLWKQNDLTPDYVEPFHSLTICIIVSFHSILEKTGMVATFNSETPDADA
jgi:hypothetical protein